jgi:hypothetical protein
LDNKRLFFVGVGSAQAAGEFADKLNLDPSLCFGDESGAVGDVLGLEKGFRTMWNPPAIDNMMKRNDEDSLKSLGDAYMGAAKAIGFKNLAPKNMADTMRQGGTFVFKGDKLLLEHYDARVGDNCDVEKILAAISKN